MSNPSETGSLLAEDQSVGPALQTDLVHGVKNISREFGLELASDLPPPQH